MNLARICWPYGQVFVRAKDKLSSQESAFISVHAMGLDVYEHCEPAYPDRADYVQEDKNVLDYIWDDRADLPFYDLTRGPSNGVKNGRFEPNRASRKGTEPTSSVQGLTMEERNYQQWREHGGRY